MDIYSCICTHGNQSRGHLPPCPLAKQQAEPREFKRMIIDGIPPKNEPTCDTMVVIEKSAYDAIVKERDKLKHDNEVLTVANDSLHERDDKISKIAVSLREEIEDKTVRLKRTVNAAYYALLEMSAWMGIPEKKREKQIEQGMENVKYCAENDLRHLDEQQRIRDERNLNKPDEAEEE